MSKTLDEDGLEITNPYGTAEYWEEEDKRVASLPLWRRIIATNVFVPFIGMLIKQTSPPTVPLVVLQPQTTLPPHSCHVAW